MFRQTFEELKLTGQLPSPPGVVMRVLKMSQSDSHSAEEISQTIMADSALTGRLLKLANSAGSAVANPATTVSEATMRLGVRTVMNVALGLSLVSANRSGRCSTFDYDRYWSTALARAVAAQNIARQFRTVPAAEAYVLGLLSEIGKLALASVYPEEYSVILGRVGDEDGVVLARVEREEFEIDHGDVGSYMLEDWGLPANFTQAVQVYEQIGRIEIPENSEAAPMARVLNCAHRLSSTCLKASAASMEDAVELAARLEELRTMMNMEPEPFSQLCRTIGREWTEWGAILDVPTGKMATLEEIRSRGEAAQALGVRAPNSGGNQDASGDQGPVHAEVVHHGHEDGSKQMRILAVDDDPMSLKLLERTLTKAGHSVITASNGEAALKLALEQSPHIVIADWMMPQMDGLQLCQSLRRIEYGRNIFFLLLTGRGEEDRIVEAFDAGVDDYVTKPFSPRVMMARLKGGQRVIELQERVESDRKMILKQVAELGLMTRKLRSAALTDVLTELPNRRYIMKRLESDWGTSLRTNSPLSVVMIDIDHFKKVNDTYGHDVGDLVLKETARVLRAVARQGEELARLGGEEFIVICPNSTEAQAAIAAERLRAAVERNLVKSPMFEGRVTVSLGVAQRTADMTSQDALVKAADEAVYGAKTGGRNRACVVSSLQRKALPA